MALRDDLPLVNNKTGWPWSDETDPSIYASRLDWPKISIITPSYNQGKYIEETIRSILLQNYPNLEYIIIDAVSDDDTVSIIEKYSRWISYWVSEPDNGQSNAINKGFKIATGEIINWINSDDQLAKESLYEIGLKWMEQRFDLLVGADLIKIKTSKADRSEIWYPKIWKDINDFLRPNRISIPQSSTFFSYTILSEVGFLREDLHYIMDWELYYRIALYLNDKKRNTVTTSNSILALQVIHDDCKTFKHGEKFREEYVIILNEYSNSIAIKYKIFIHRHLKRLRTFDDITQQSLKGSLLGLIKILFRSPNLIYKRFYLGAIKRVLINKTKQAVS